MHAHAHMQQLAHIQFHACSLTLTIFSCICMQCIEENFPEAVNTDIGSDASLIASNRGLDLRDGAEDLQRVRDELMQNWDDLTGLADSCSYIGDSLIPSLQTNKMCLPCFQDLVWAGENEASLEISGDVKQNLTEHSVDQEPDKGAGGENDEAQDNTNRD